jgi:two-component system, cell cycle response regulator
MVVSVMAAEAGLERGLALLYDEEGFLSLKGIVGLDETAGSELAEMVIAFHQRGDLTGYIIVATDIVSEHATGIRDALIIRVGGKSRTQGVVALFNNRNERLSEEMPLQGVTFLLQQSSRAIENASRFSAARNLANIDELTGLFNYRYLETALDREIKRAERYRSSLSVVFLDLDQFKDINDKHGHLVGSKVLKEVGLLIKSLVREVDTVIRYGGDEYTIILVESTNVGAARVAERIRHGVEKHRFLTDEGYDIRITASLGYACYPDDSKTYAELLEMADQAMYRGKFSGKNVVFHIRQQEQPKQGD